MKGLGYFEKLSLAARWFLPQEEAESTIEDYRDILLELHASEEARERFGPPVKLIIGLGEPEKMRRWHFYFAMMALCAFAPLFRIIFAGLGRDYHNMFLIGENTIFCGIFFLFGLEIILRGSYEKKLFWFLIVVLGAATGFLWMRDSWLPIRYTGLRFGAPLFMWVGAGISFLCFGFRKRKGKISKTAIAMMVFALLVVAGMYCFAMYSLQYFNIFLSAADAIRIACGCLTVLFFAGALVSLVLARIADPRWRSVFILCLTGLVVCFEVHHVLWNMSPDFWQASGGYRRDNYPNPAVRNQMAVELSWSAGIGVALAAFGLL